MTAAGLVRRAGGGPVDDRVNALIEKHKSSARPARAICIRRAGRDEGSLKVPRRRQTPPSLGLCAGVLLAALALEGPSASAQNADATDFPLLAPTLDGNPKTPPVFRKADTQTPAATTTATPVGQLPNFDDQPGMGAGSTGFNSSNTKPKPNPSPRPPAAPSLRGRTRISRARPRPKRRRPRPRRYRCRRFWP